MFDSEARRVEGYSAQLPVRAEGAAALKADCLDEMHRLVKADGFHVAAIVGRAESELTAEDRKYWPAFEAAKWYPTLAEGAETVLGIGCVDQTRFALVVAEKSMLATIVDACPAQLPDGLTCVAIDEQRWLLAGEVPEAGGAYSDLKHEMHLKGSLEEYLETAAEGDPHLAGLESAAKKFRVAYDALLRVVPAPEAVMAAGATLLKSPSWTQRIANALGVPLTLATEPEPAGRGAALWALSKIGAIESLRSLEASTAAVFEPATLETTQNDS